MPGTDGHTNQSAVLVAQLRISQPGIYKPTLAVKLKLN